MLRCFTSKVGWPAERQRSKLRSTGDACRAKHWKFDQSDLAARAQWDGYQRAYEQLLAATHTPWAPWTIVPADSKTHRNLMVATLLKAVLERLDLRYPPGDPALAHLTVE